MYIYILSSCVFIPIALCKPQTFDRNIQHLAGSRIERCLEAGEAHQDSAPDLGLQIQLEPGLGRTAVLSKSKSEKSRS